MFLLALCLMKGIHDKYGDFELSKEVHRLFGNFKKSLNVSAKDEMYISYYQEQIETFCKTF